MSVSQKRAIDLSILGLDWNLAVRRFSKDIRDDFFPDPLEYRDFLADRAATAERVGQDLAQFFPRVAGNYEIPKANLLVRHAIQLGPVDRIAYQALVDSLYGAVDACLERWSFSHRFVDAKSDYMFGNPIEAWFRFCSAVGDAAAGTPGACLVVTDIAQYYENINFKKLRRQVENVLAGVDESKGKVVDALFRCLRFWSPYKYIGLPQNLDASSALGNAFLDYVDKRMVRLPIRYFRYMDDIRIVCSTEAKARTAIVELVTALRELDLTLNAQKTHLLSESSDLWSEFVGFEDPVVARIEQLIAKRNVSSANEALPLVVEESRKLLQTQRSSDRKFRFLLNRLIGFRRFRGLEWPVVSDMVDDLIGLLVTRPCDSATICRFLAASELSETQFESLERLLTEEPLCIYSWQNYQLWMLLAQRMRRSDRLLGKANSILKSEPPNPNRAGACLYLGACGDYSDREAIRHRLEPEAPRLLRRAELLAIQESHPADRKPVYRDCEQDTELAFLAHHIDQFTEPIYVPEPTPIGIEELPQFVVTSY
jgi:hypothetical protein